MLVCYEKEAMKPTQESVDYACSVEQYKPKDKIADIVLYIVLAVAAFVVLMDVFVWKI
jgi:hypothetical protein